MGDEAAKNIIEPAYCEFKPSIFIEVWKSILCPGIRWLQETLWQHAHRNLPVLVDRRWTHAQSFKAFWYFSIWMNTSYTTFNPAELRISTYINIACNVEKRFKMFEPCETLMRTWHNWPLTLSFDFINMKPLPSQFKKLLERDS